MKECKENNCNEKHYALDLCERHYNVEKAQNPGRGDCTECDEPAWSKGLCNKHYSKQQYRKRRNKELNKVCTRHDCDKPQNHPRLELCKTCKDQRQRLKEFGITFKDWDRMMEEQEGLCAGCGSPPRSRNKLSVDHCHTTGAVRGLLCHNCNVALGLLKDNTRTLESLIGYLNDPTNKDKEVRA